MGENDDFSEQPDGKELDAEDHPKDTQDEEGTVCEWDAKEPVNSQIRCENRSSEEDS